MKDAAVRRWALVAAVSLARTAFGYQFQSLASLGPELLERFGLGYAELGGLIGLYMAPGVLVALPGGLLGRRYGERLVVGGGLALMTFGAAVCAGAGGPGGIGAGRALAGVGAVMLVVMQGKMIGDRFPGRSFLPVMGLVVGAFPVGVGLVELTHGPVVRALGWPGMFIVGTGIAALAFLLFLVSSERAHPDAGAAWALPSRRECGLVAVAGVVWTAYNAGYYGFLSYMPSVAGGAGAPGGGAGSGADGGDVAEPAGDGAGRGAGGTVRQPPGVPGGDGGRGSWRWPGRRWWTGRCCGGCCSGRWRPCTQASSSASARCRRGRRTGRWGWGCSTPSTMPAGRSCRCCAGGRRTCWATWPVR